MKNKHPHNSSEQKENLPEIIGKIKKLTDEYLSNGGDINKLAKILEIDTKRTDEELLRALNEKYKSNVDQCIESLNEKYNYNYIDGDTKVFVHNEYTFAKNARRLAESTNALLLRTDGISIEASTGSRGKFRFKLDAPMNGIKYIECQIIKDKI